MKSEKKRMDGIVLNADSIIKIAGVIAAILAIFGAIYAVLVGKRGEHFGEEVTI